MKNKKMKNKGRRNLITLIERSDEEIENENERMEDEGEGEIPKSRPRYFSAGLCYFSFVFLFLHFHNVFGVYFHFASPCT